MQRILIHTDGGARGNPGPAGAGAVLKRADGEVIAEVSEYLGERTNNWAEYQALILALTALEKQLPSSELKDAAVEVYMDSELIVKQLSGEYRVKEPALKEQHAIVRSLLERLPRVVFRHVRRAENEKADQLANDAMDRGYTKGV